VVAHGRPGEGEKKEGGRSVFRWRIKEKEDPENDGTRFKSGRYSLSKGRIPGFGGSLALFGQKKWRRQGLEHITDSGVACFGGA